MKTVTKTNITNMKKLFFAAAAVLALAACSTEPAEVYIPKGQVEYAGNAFTSFSLGSDVKIYTSQNPDNKSQWVIQCVVPIRKETEDKILDLSIDLIPLDDKGLRVRDSFVLHGEDLSSMVPVYNSDNYVERTIVFSVSEAGRKKYFKAKEATELVNNVRGVRMDFNARVEEAPAPAPVVYNPVDPVCRRFGVYTKLNEYDAALRRKDKKGAQNIENDLWKIEKQVKADGSIHQDTRDRFVKYVEDKLDQIRDKY